MRRSVVAAFAVLAVSFGVTACNGGDDKPDLAACKTAMKEQLRKAMDNPTGPSGTRPKECKGASDADLERIAGELLAGS